MTQAETTPTPEHRYHKHPWRRRIEQHLVYWATFLATWGLVRLPLRWVQRLGNGVGWIVFTCFPKRRRLADGNVEKCFPGRFTAEERRAIVLGCCRNVSKTMLELLKMPRMKHEDVRAMVDFDGLERFDAAYKLGKGVIVVTAHYGNWELGASTLSLLGYKMHVVARDASGAQTADIINRSREAMGIEVLGREGTLAMVKALRRGGAIGILPDQHQVGGAVLTFLGRPAATAIGPAMLALRSGATIIPVFVRRIEGDRFLYLIHEPVEMPATEDRQEAAVALAQKLNDIISAEVMAHPEQWLWLHDRWKAERQAAQA
jgi:KDO2-lipid IV(A) lauroyltransferase